MKIYKVEIVIRGHQLPYGVYTIVAKSFADAYRKANKILTREKKIGPAYLQVRSIMFVNYVEKV